MFENSSDINEAQKTIFERKITELPNNEIENSAIPKTLPDCGVIQIIGSVTEANEGITCSAYLMYNNKKYYNNMQYFIPNIDINDMTFCLEAFSDNTEPSDEWIKYRLDSIEVYEIS